MKQLSGTVDIYMEGMDELYKRCGISPEELLASSEIEDYRVALIEITDANCRNEDGKCNSSCVDIALRAL